MSRRHMLPLNKYINSVPVAWKQNRSQKKTFRGLPKGSLLLIWVGLADILKLQADQLLEIQFDVFIVGFSTQQSN